MGQKLSVSIWTSKSSSVNYQHLLPWNIDLLYQPLDIIKEISDHLEPDSAVALAITCKAFNLYLSPVAFRRLRQAEQAVKEAAIEMIERDIGNRYHYCALCDDFHRWSSSWNFSKAPAGVDAVHIPECSEPTGRGCGLRPFRVCMFDSPQDITYSHCRLVMNRHFHGPSRGLPVSSLEVEEHDTCVANSLDPVHPRGCSFDHRRSWKAKIINDELYVACTLTVDEYGPVLRHWSGLDMGSQRFARWLLNRICNHGPILWTEHGMFWRVFPRMIATSFMDTPMMVSVKMRGYCRYCLTDYDASVCFREGKACTAKITSYHQLGNFRSCRDWKWANAFQCPSRIRQDYTMYIRHGLYAPDIVRKRWAWS
ncbi:hypothetical protein VSDG_07818 [Cytospora chrysosperma]|uniref:F-box domain-containing protein n=1 Tax=Cytospora chrysosperma TaxID=252740 RepID=A0A423VJE0_CYTCH|nr:hypothetical protein VSDG_07818 [Valsa sordida]